MDVKVFPNYPTTLESAAQFWKAGLRMKLDIDVEGASLLGKGA